MDEMEKQEIISALADGQLQGAAFEEGVALAVSDVEAREAWHTYHLIGDVLRSGEHAAVTMPTAFMSRLQVRLRQEKELTLVESPAPVRTAHSEPAANDSSFRWKLVAGFASVAAVAAIGWSLVIGPGGAVNTQPQLAAIPPGAVLAGTERGVMLRDPKLDEFLAAHRQLGGASALQMPAGFLRNATFEGASR
jgi:sigma-E factor negative regulatory protein RseA